MRTNAFLVVHHVVFCTFSVLAFQAESLFLLKVNIVVSCFATYEFLLYAALIARKVPALQKCFRWLMIVGLGFYAVTRVIQLVMLIGLFVLGFGAMSHTSRNSALYWVSMALCAAVIVLQLYTFVIYRAIWQSTLAKQPARQLAPSVLPADGVKRVELARTIKVYTCMSQRVRTYTSTAARIARFVISMCVPLRCRHNFLQRSQIWHPCYCACVHCDSGHTLLIYFFVCESVVPSAQALHNHIISFAKLLSMATCPQSSNCMYCSYVLIAPALP